MDRLNISKNPKEQLLFILEPKFRKSFLPVLYYFFVILPVIIFCITLPVVATSSYEVVFWGANIDLISKKILFYMAFICYAYAIVVFPQLKMGKYYFFNDRLEIYPFLFKKKYILFFRELTVFLFINPNKTKSVVIYKDKIPRFIENPVKYIINKYIKGFYVIVHPDFLKHSSNIDNAIELLEKNSSIFIKR